MLALVEQDAGAQLPPVGATGERRSYVLEGTTIHVDEISLHDGKGGTAARIRIDLGDERLHDPRMALRLSAALKAGGIVLAEGRLWLQAVVSGRTDGERDVAMYLVRVAARTRVNDQPLSPAAAACFAHYD